MQFPWNNCYAGTRKLISTGTGPGTGQHTTGTATAHHLQHTTAPVVTDNTKMLSEINNQIFPPQNLTLQLDLVYNLIYKHFDTIKEISLVL